MELETIPAKSQEPGGGVDLSQAAQRVEPENTDAEPARDDHHNEAEHPEPPPAEVHPVLEAFYSRVGEIELPGEGVSVWMKHRAELGPLNPADREALRATEVLLAAIVNRSVPVCVPEFPSGNEIQLTELEATQRQPGRVVTRS